MLGIEGLSIEIVLIGMLAVLIIGNMVIQLIANIKGITAQKSNSSGTIGDVNIIVPKEKIEELCATSENHERRLAGIEAEYKHLRQTQDEAKVILKEQSNSINNLVTNVALVQQSTQELLKIVRGT